MNKYRTSDVIATMVSDRGLGVYPFVADIPWPIYTRRLPDHSVDEIVSIRDVVTPTIGRLTRTGEYLFNPGFILRVRSVRDDPANDKIVEILNFFETVTRSRVTVKDKVYIVGGIHLQSGPVDTGEDGSKRHVFSANFITSICEV